MEKFLLKNEVLVLAWIEGGRLGLGCEIEFDLATKMLLCLVDWAVLDFDKCSRSKIHCWQDASVVLFFACSDKTPSVFLESRCGESTKSISLLDSNFLFNWLKNWLDFLSNNLLLENDRFLNLFLFSIKFAVDLGVSKLVKEVSSGGTIVLKSLSLLALVSKLGLWWGRERLDVEDMFWLCNEWLLIEDLKMLCCLVISTISIESVDWLHVSDWFWLIELWWLKKWLW